MLCLDFHHQFLGKDQNLPLSPGNADLAHDRSAHFLLPNPDGQSMHYPALPTQGPPGAACAPILRTWDAAAGDR